MVCQAPRDSPHIESGRFGRLDLRARRLHRSPHDYGVIWPIVTFSGRLGAAVLLFGLIGTTAPALGEVVVSSGTTVSALPVWRPERLSHLGAAQTVIGCNVAWRCPPGSAGTDWSQQPIASRTTAGRQREPSR
jgi:hypothetical protein